jgi:toxin ParE1/3/4
MTYKISEKAEEDLEEIWLYTLRIWSREQADRYLNLIFDEIAYVSVNPKSGQDVDHIRKGYRCAKVKSHLIFYKHKKGKDHIEVIRILHQQMDVENRMNE